MLGAENLAVKRNSERGRRKCTASSFVTVFAAARIISFSSLWFCGPSYLHLVEGVFDGIQEGRVWREEHDVDVVSLLQLRPELRELLRVMDLGTQGAHRA